MGFGTKFMFMFYLDKAFVLKTRAEAHLGFAIVENDIVSIVNTGRWS